MVLKTANSVPPSQQNRARQPRQDTAKSAKSTASYDGGRLRNRTPSGTAGSAEASSNNAPDNNNKPTP